MNGNTENLVLEHLKAIRGDIQKLTNEIEELKMRVSELENSMGTVLSCIGDHYSTGARQQVAIDRINQRMGRIEKRLELAD